MNSRLFQATPLKNSRLARLGWTQLNKRSPWNLRPLTGVPAEKNAKGIALFALGAIANYRRLKSAESENEARSLLAELLRLRVSGYSGAAWGYNFDWQSRNFFAPKGTPTIVPTAFAARALTEGFLAFQDDDYLRIAKSVCEFIANDLHRSSESDHEICFSYSPLDNTQIFNASLLAAETLARVGSLTGRQELLDLAVRAARYVVLKQQPDGAWAYGLGNNQSWIDSFHTAYVLSSILQIMQRAKETEDEFRPSLMKGYDYWRESFFLADGWPKYYHDSLFPADAHAAATAIVTFVEFGDLDSAALSLAEKVAGWTIRNLRDRTGFFYYQRRRFHTVYTPFMRWTQSWMVYALARLLEAKER